MTLAIFKNGVLAADTRTTHRCHTHNDRNKCAHCDKGATAVNDERLKIHTPTPRQKPMLRGEKVLAVAGSGESKLIDRMVRIIMRGKNVEEVYSNYLDVHGTFTDSPSTCTLIVVCETHNYTLQVLKSPALKVTQVPKSEIINIGSGASSAAWINRLLKKLPAAAVVNLAMYEDITVGGEIDFIDFNKPEPKLERAVKIDPESLLHQFQEMFALGAVAKANKDREAKAAVKPLVRKAPARKLAVKKTINKKG